MVGVAPLGTGNDMARVMGWGAQFGDEEKLPIVLKEMECSSFHLLDRWSVQFTMATNVDMSPIVEAMTVRGGREGRREGRREEGGGREEEREEEREGGRREEGGEGREEGRREGREERGGRRGDGGGREGGVEREERGGRRKGGRRKEGGREGGSKRNVAKGEYLIHYI